MGAYKIWEGGPVVNGSEITIDTETELIVDHNIPKLVLMSVNDGKETHVAVGRERCMGYLDRLASANHRKVAMHNVAFDYWVLEAHPYLKALVEDGMLYDTMILYCMHQTATKGRIGQRSLEHVIMDLFKVQIEKDQELRTSFKVGEPLSQAQLDYAASDAIWTHRAFQELMLRLDKLDRKAASWLLSHSCHVKGAIALAEISRNGLLVDNERRLSIKDKLERKVDGIRKGVLTANGVWKPSGGPSSIGLDGLPTQESINNGSKDTAQLERILEMYEKRLGKRFARTEKAGKIQLTAESMEAFLDSDIPILKALAEHDHAVKICSTYLSDEHVKADGKVHTRFDNFLVTGRTSSSKPNIQNLPRKEGVRGIFIPSPGKIFVAADFAQLEIVTLAQHCIWMHGKSRMADLINYGIDVHGWFASLLKKKLTDKTPLAEAKAIIKEFKTSDPVTYKHSRQLAKAGNFGLPGGLGSETFIPYAKGYGVTLTSQESKELKDQWKRAFPEMNLHLQPDSEIYGVDETWYRGENMNGLVRGHSSYTEICNFPFQSLGSETAKIALWDTLKTSGTFTMVDFIHDEILAEIDDEDPKSNTERAEHLCRIMADAANQILLDVPIKAEPTLMRRWIKGDCERDDQGNIIPLEDK